MTTTPKDPVDAHLQLVYNFAGVVAQNLPWQAAYDAVEASARALAAVPAPPLTMTGYQLREALEFLAPDGTAAQVEQEVCIQHGPERVCDAGTPDETTDPAGLYCWLSDCPEEGSIALTGEDARIRLETAPLAQQAGGVPAGWHEAVQRLVTGFEHVSGIARQWEPDHSSGADRAKWARATEACADVAKLLAAAPSPSAVQPTVFLPGEYERMTENGAKAWAGVDPQELRGAVQPPATSPQEATRSLGKWLNEHPNRPINLEDVAMLVHHVQAVQPLSEAQIAPMSEWRAEKMARDWVADQTTDAEDLIRQVEDFHGIVTPKEPK